MLLLRANAPQPCPHRPNFTVSSPGPTLSPLQAIFLIIMSAGLYGVFLAIQNVRHRDYFMLPNSFTRLRL
jgi:Ca2+:H+ antiporter